MSADGINRLINVTQQKASNANDAALEGANKQKDLIADKKNLRGLQNTFETFVKDSSLSKSDTSMKYASEASISKPAVYLTKFANSAFETQGKYSAASLSKNIAEVSSNPTRYARGLNAYIAAFKNSFEKSADASGKDKMGNSEIQALMSDLNEAQTLASSTKKKLDDQNSSAIGKIG